MVTQRRQKRIYFDLETGGLDRTKHPVIQIAAVVVWANTFDQIESFESKVEFDTHLCSPEALEINSYDQEVWKNEAMPANSAISGFNEFMRRHATVKQIAKRTGKPFYTARLCGHNIIRFDMPFYKEWVSRMMGRTFIPANYVAMDTVQQAVWYFERAEATGGEMPKSFKQVDLAKFFGIPTPDAHDALADVRTNIEISKIMVMGA